MFKKIKIQEKIMNVLNELHKKYNIILRSHPQDYYGYALHGSYHCIDMMIRFCVSNNVILVSSCRGSDPLRLLAIISPDYDRRKCHMAP